MNSQSAVKFPGNSRIHIALAVSDLQRSKKFYETLFGISPAKQRPGYVKFEPHDPSVNLTLNQVDNSRALDKPATHYGIQVQSTGAVEEAIARLSDAELSTFVEEHTTCCYAVQDKVWVTDPDGNKWEVFVVLDADAPQRKDEHSNCCADDCTSSSSTCC